MSIDTQIALCTEHYQKWKDLALSNKDISLSKKAMKRAFFWIELRTAFITLHAVEQIVGERKEVKEKLLVVKANLSKKLAEYANEILNEINI